jgi:prepilin-type N-terminal cleavage/methylation domain-containing protein
LPPRSAAGFTLVELAITIAITALVVTIAFDSFNGLGRASNQGLAEQEVTRLASRVLDQIRGDLQTADADTLVYSASEPGQITFQQVVGYDATAAADGDKRLRSRPIAYRGVTLANGAGPLGVERVELGSYEAGEEITICMAQEEGGERQTQTILVDNLNEYLKAGATIGPCGDEPIPTSEVFGTTRAITGYVALADLNTGDLPGLNFDVRYEARATYVDVALTVEFRPRGERTPVRRRFEATVNLLNR